MPQVSPENLQLTSRLYAAVSVCKAISYVEMLTAFASVTNLSALAVERLAGNTFGPNTLFLFISHRDHTT